MMNRRHFHPSKPVLAALSLAFFGFGTSLPVQAADQLKLGLVSFYSGPVSGPVGIPSRNGADLIIEAVNAGTLPEPYSGKGIGGREIVPVYSDEAVEPANEYRNLVQRQNVDAVVGYASSGSCVGVTPLAEELKTLTIFYYCGTTRTFEEGPKTYVFRTMNSQDVENIAAARYLLSVKPDVKSVSGINQNYSWGQESWRDFTKTLQILKPDIKIESAQFPKIFAGQYGAEITALSRTKADVIHSSFWGGDLDALVVQAAPRGLFKQSLGVLTTGATAMHTLAKQIPDGTIIGVRGNAGALANPSEFNDWFRKAYKDKYGSDVTFPAYYMAQAVLALKAAGDKAQKAAGKVPGVDEIREALVGLTFMTPAGPVAMARGEGHQAATEIAYGQFKLDGDKPSLVNIHRYQPDCVIAPEGMKSLEWIEGGFQGAKCK